MADETYTTHEAALAEARKLNDARIRDNFEYVASPKYDFSSGEMVVVGWYVGMCSND